MGSGQRNVILNSKLPYVADYREMINARVHLENHPQQYFNQFTGGKKSKMRKKKR